MVYIFYCDKCDYYYYYHYTPHTSTNEYGNKWELPNGPFLGAVGPFVGGLCLMCYHYCIKSNTMCFRIIT